MNTSLCPFCKRECIIVKTNKVYSLVAKHFKQHVKSTEYGFCENPDCDIVYFGIDKDNCEIYFKRDLTEEMK